MRFRNRSLPHAMQSALRLLPVAAFLFAVPAQAQLVEETMIDRTFDAEPGGRLEVAVADGDVTVETGSADEMHIRVVVVAKNKQRAREWFKEQRFTVRQTGGTIQITSDPRSGYDWRAWRDEPHGIRVVATVPETFDADVATSDGDVTVKRLAGTVRIKTSDGDILAGELSGPALALNTSDGDIDIGRLDSDRVNVRTSDGNIELGTVRARRVTVHSSDGDIRISSLTGDAEVRTSDGNIDIGQLDSDRVNVRTSDGNIELGTVRARRVMVHTSDGDVRISSLTGDAEVRTSDGDLDLGSLDGKTVAITSDGDIRVRRVRGDATLRTYDGDIHVRELATVRSIVHTSHGTISLANVDGDLEATGSAADIRLDLRAPGDVTASSSSGDVFVTVRAEFAADVHLAGDDVDIASGFTFRGDMDGEVAHGTINGGGKSLVVRAPDGSVVLRSK